MPPPLQVATPEAQTSIAAAAASTTGDAPAAEPQKNREGGQVAAADSKAFAAGATGGGEMFARLGIDKVVVQSSWDDEEDQELHDYLSGSGVAVEIVDEDDIAAMEVSSDTMIFADTGVVQQLLGPASIVDTYPPCLAPLLNRRVTKGKLSEIDPAHLVPPFFAKPAGAHKTFDARLVRDAGEAASLAEEVGGGELYACEAVDFETEHRMFLGPGKLWGLQEYSKYMVFHRVVNANPNRAGPITVVNAAVPDTLVRRARELAAELGYVVVDIGRTSDGRWCLVEANPPFALSSYDLDIGVYIEYCCAAWQHLVLSTVA